MSMLVGFQLGLDCKCWFSAWAQTKVQTCPLSCSSFIASLKHKDPHGLTQVFRNLVLFSLVFCLTGICGGCTLTSSRVDTGLVPVNEGSGSTPLAESSA